MVNAKLIINGQEFPVHYRMLRMIAGHLPEGSNYEPLARALAGLDVPSITMSMLRNRRAAFADLDTIWENGDLDMRRMLAGRSDFRKNLTDAQAEQIISMNDREMLGDIAEYAEELYPEKGEKQAMRLSGKMADALLEFMASHPDGEVREKLAQNPSAPVKFRPSFAAMLKDGSAPSSSDVARITQADLDLLRNSPTEVLKTVAGSVEDIEDKEARAEAIEFLCSYPDPAIRLEMAENSWAPRSALQRLCDDPDPDVAEAARESIKDD